MIQPRSLWRKVIKVIIFKTTSLWHLLASWMENFTVASFQFVNPFDMNATSKLEDHWSFFCALACTHVIQTTRLVLNVVQPISFLKPRWLKTAIDHRLLPKGNLKFLGWWTSVVIESVVIGEVIGLVIGELLRSTVTKLWPAEGQAHSSCFSITLITYYY